MAGDIEYLGNGRYRLRPLPDPEGWGMQILKKAQHGFIMLSFTAPFVVQKFRIKR